MDSYPRIPPAFYPVKGVSEAGQHAHENDDPAVVEFSLVHNLRPSVRKGCRRPFIAYFFEQVP